MIRGLAVLATLIYLLQVSESGTIASRKRRAYTQLADWAITVKGDNCQLLANLAAHDEANIKDSLVSEHNRLRADYNSDVQSSGCPAQSISSEMTWDSNLARLAQLWANMCTWGHGYLCTSCDAVGEKCYGQNVVFDSQPYEYAQIVMTQNFVMMIELMEKANTDVCARTCYGGECGHYLTATHGGYSKLGCAFTNPQHTCQMVYTQDDEVEGPVPAYPFPDPWAMYVCVYA